MAKHTSSDAETGHEVVGKGPDGGLPVQRSPVGHDHTVDWNTDNESDVKPVNVLIPVRGSHWKLSDVWLRWIVL